MEGLVMGTRSGDLDPGILLYLERECGFSTGRLDRLLNSQSGLLGVCGENDMREILTRLEQGDERAELACAIFCYRLKKYIGAYAAVLGRLDARVFSGGIGAKSAVIRERVCAGLDLLGIRLDPVRNRSVAGEVAGIDDNSGGVRVLAVETDEELEIARQGLALWSSATSS
jgi:acetate kinase